MSFIFSCYIDRKEVSMKSGLEDRNNQSGAERAGHRNVVSM